MPGAAGVPATTLSARPRNHPISHATERRKTGVSAAGPGSWASRPRNLVTGVASCRLVLGSGSPDAVPCSLRYPGQLAGCLRLRGFCRWHGARSARRGAAQRTTTECRASPARPTPAARARAALDGGEHRGDSVHHRGSLHRGGVPASGSSPGARRRSVPRIGHRGAFPGGASRGGPVVLLAAERRRYVRQWVWSAFRDLFALAHVRPSALTSVRAPLRAPQ